MIEFIGGNKLMEEFIFINNLGSLLYKFGI
jgi:hypothetical protein